MSDILEGAFKTLEPVLVGSGIVNPLGTRAALVGASGAAKATELLSRTVAGADATPERCGGGGGLDGTGGAAGHSRDG
jgi:hypothetical protein